MSSTSITTGQLNHADVTWVPSWYGVGHLGESIPPGHSQKHLCSPRMLKNAPLNPVLYLAIRLNSHR